MEFVTSSANLKMYIYSTTNYMTVPKSFMKEGQIAPPSRPYADSLKTPEVVGVGPIITLLLPIWSATSRLAKRTFCLLSRRAPSHDAFYYVRLAATLESA